MPGATARDGRREDHVAFADRREDARRAPARASAALRDTRSRCRPCRSQPVAHLLAVVLRALAQPRRVIARGLDGDHDQRRGRHQRLVRQIDLHDAAPSLRKVAIAHRARCDIAFEVIDVEAFRDADGHAARRALRGLAYPRPVRRRWSDRADRAPRSPPQ